MRISFRLPETRRYFESFITRSDCDGFDIRVEDEDPALFPLICPTGVLDPFSEAYLLMSHASAFLLPYQRVLIHGVSLVWHGYSWLITAPSGTGKTTQLHHWQQLWPDEFELINGDKSVLALCDDDRFWLYPSPWMGKEKEFGTASAPLGGIIVLEQAGQNEMCRLTPRDSVLRIFQQFLFLGLHASEVRAVGALESRLLADTPVWLLKNLGDEASARLMRQTMLDYEAGAYEKV